MGNTHIHIHPSRHMHHADVRDSIGPEERDMKRFGDKKKYMTLCKQKQKLRDRAPGISRYSAEACGADPAAIRSVTSVRHSPHTPETPPPCIPHLGLLSG